MKKNYILTLLVMCLGLQSLVEAQTTKQKHTDRYYNSWRLGLNMGAMWQVADVRSTPGFAGGFTLEKGFCENKTNFFSLALKGRGLWGNTYGIDFVRNYDIKDNPSLNGTYDPKVNYDTSMTGNMPFIYNNYKTKVAEGALELQICFNRLRERTNILLNLWGGIGFVSYRTRINALNETDTMYNYNLVNSSGSKALTLSSHDFLLDDSYESFGTGSKKGNVLTWAPSCGIGFGYRFNDYISLLWEHKITFPQGTYSDYLDGIKASNNDWLGCVKDYYHYSALTLNIRLGGKSKTKSTSNVNNYTPVTTNTIVNIPTNTVVTNPTTSVVTQPVVINPPIVTITNPPTTPYTESVNRNFNVTANVFNVSQRNQLYVTFNGVEVKNYSWNSKTISFPAQLNAGNNIVSVTATNTAGNDSKSAVIIYSGVPPQITITTPGNNKYTSAQSNSDVYATILNVEATEFISVKLNGQPFYGFSYDVTSKVFGMNAALNTGTNTVDILATNAFGQDTKTQILIYKPASVLNPTVVAAKPVTVVITDPATNPYKSNTTTYKVKSVVTGVTSQSQVTVTVNSNPVPFSYVSGNVEFNVSLVAGNNIIQVSAKNARQADSKSTIITYEAPKKITPPTVVIVNPNPSPYTTTGNTYAFKAQTTNISDKSQLEVKLNGNSVMNWITFDAGSGFIDIYADLITNSNNVFEVKATNPYGTANASAIVKQEQPKSKVICHRVDRATMQTITIFENEWAAHQAHGDFEGACPKENVEIPVDNDITICHKNADGSKQTIVVKQSTWSQHQAHGDVLGACPKTNIETPVDNDITICHKNADGSKQTIVVKQSTWPQHQAHGDVMGACPKNQIEAPLDNDITICHMNPDGSKQTIVVKESTWAQHQAHGDVKGNCPKTSNVEIVDPDMLICHKNNDGSVVKMTIKTSQWSAHQAHGDYVGGECTASTNTAATSSTVEICHNNGDGTKTTMVIQLSQFSAHRAHGDLMGKCPPAAANTNTTPATTSITVCHKNGDGSTTTISIPSDQWSVHRGHGDLLGTCPPAQKTENPGKNSGDIKNNSSENNSEKKNDDKTENGTKSPGRTTTTTTTTTTEEPKATETPKKLTPR